MRLRDKLTWNSYWRFLLWRSIGLPATIILRCTDGTVLALRQSPADDVDTAYEIHVAEVYKSPRPLSSQHVRRIIDLGANTGISCVFWARSFPNAEILAFEPHPLHVELLNRQLLLNDLQNRVQVRPQAAATSDGRLYLTDAGVKSRVVKNAKAGTICVETIDFFCAIKDMAIDILKVDIEGGEYQLLTDDRFATVAAKAIVVEWHRDSAIGDGRTWVKQRLQELGYDVEPGAWNTEENGFLWGYHQT